MARTAVAALLLVSLLAGAFVSQAQAKLALCNASAVPATPNNVQIVGNKSTPKGAEIKVIWNSGTTQNTGCVDFWRVIMVVNGKEVGMQSADKPQSGSDPTGTFTYLAKAGDMVAFKVYAQNIGTQKKSGVAATPSAVRAASGGATTDQGRKMML